MHELSICRNVVELACAHSEGQPIERLRLAIGELTAVMPEALEFCFVEARKGTLLAAAALEIEYIPGLAQCLECAERFHMPPTGARCPEGHRQFKLLAGEELKIIELELQARPQ